MRRDAARLEDIIAAADDIAAYLSGVDEEEFRATDLVQSAVLHKLTVIGEAAAGLSDEFRTEHPSIPWADIVGFRNILVHAYFRVEPGIVWVTAVEEAPALREACARILGDLR